MAGQGPRRAGAALALALALAAPAQALELDWSTGVSMEFSDNIHRSVDARSEQVGVLWAGLWLREDTPNLRLGLSSVLEYRDYQRNTYDDETLFRLSAMLTASLVPQRLHWTLENYFRQIREDDRAPLTPDNRQDSNVFWTGPNLYFRLGQRTLLDLGARFGHYYYGDADADNMRLAGSASLQRRLWPRLDGALNFEAMRVEYEHDNGFVDFDRYDAYGSIDYRLRRTDLRAELGQTRVERDGTEDIEGALGALRLTRRMAGDARAGIHYVQQYTESGASLLAAGSDPLLVDLVTTTVPRDIAYERRVEVHYARLLGRIDTLFRGYWRDEDFEFDDELDRVSVGGRLDLGYRMTAEWAAGAYVSYRNADYRQAAREDDDWLAGVRLEHRFSRDAVGSIEVLTDRRLSNVPEAEYTENMLILGLRYGERPPVVPR